jgi:hypothetical protein
MSRLLSRFSLGEVTLLRGIKVRYRSPLDLEVGMSRTTFHFADVFSPTGFEDGTLLDGLLDDAKVGDSYHAENRMSMSFAHDVLATIVTTLAGQAKQKLELPPLYLVRVQTIGNPIRFDDAGGDRREAEEAWSHIDMRMDDDDIIGIARGIAALRKEQAEGRDPWSAVN